MDRLAQFECFVRVVELGSFSAAAQRLRSSKSVVSRQIAALEAELGARLLHRTTRSLTLTEAGQAYFERVSRILADIDEANLSVTQLQAAPRGRLRVNAPMSFGFLHLAPALPDLLERWPELEVEVTMTDRFVDLIEDGVDVAVRIAKLADSSLIARRLAPIRMVVCASPAYLVRKGMPATPADLDGHDCLAFGAGRGTEWRFVTANGAPWPVTVRGRLGIDNGDALRAAALRDLGVVMLPSFIVGADIQAGALVPLLEAFVPQERSLYAVYPHARHLSPKVRAFVDFLAGCFGPQPYWDREG